MLRVGGQGVVKNDFDDLEGGGVEVRSMVVAEFV